MTETAHAPAAAEPQILELDTDALPSPSPLMTSPRFGNLMRALARAQGEFPAIPRDRTVVVKLRGKDGQPGGSYTFKYAPLETILEKTRPALSKHELATVQAPVLVDEGGAKVEMLRTVIALGEEWLAVDVPIFVGTGENKSQAYSSGMTYSRRYGITTALCVAADEDDDGNGGEQDGDRPFPDYERTAPRKSEPGRFPRGRDGYTEPRDQHPNSGPRAPQRRQDANAANGQQSQPRHQLSERGQAGTASGPQPPEDIDPPFQDDPLPDFGLKQFMETDGAVHDADGVVTSPWGTDLTAGEVSMCKARAKVAGLDEAGILELCGVIRTATVGTALSLLKREADKALDAGA